jgi:hypothetical protein
LVGHRFDGVGCALGIELKGDVISVVAVSIFTEINVCKGIGRPKVLFVLGGRVEDLGVELRGCSDATI